MKRCQAPYLMALACSLVPAAHAMTDPTRPPASLMGPGDAQEPIRAAPPVLQSIMIGKSGRFAIIDGERVEIGSTYRDAKVVRISEDEVVLREGGSTQVLKMYPDVERNVARGREAPSARVTNRPRQP
jgi:MSHA biogenesis protein MshK